MAQALAINDAMQKVAVNLEASHDKIAGALPAHIPPARFVRTVMSVLNSTPDLQRAIPYANGRRSLLNACMRAAGDGLILDKREAALVVFGKNESAEIVYMPMIAGILKKLRNSGLLSTISAHVVYERDRFAYILGDDERIEHEPFRGGDRGKPIGSYAIARLKDGGVQRMFMDVAEIEEVRQVSRSKDRGPWVSWWGEMAKKTVLRRLCKYLPSSADIEKLWDNDGETYDLTSERDSARPDAIEADQFDNPAPQQDDAPKQTRAASRIAKKVQAKKADTKPAADDVIDVDVEDDDAVDDEDQSDEAEYVSEDDVIDEDEI